MFLSVFEKKFDFSSRDAAAIFITYLRACATTWGSQVHLRGWTQSRRIRTTTTQKRIRICIRITYTSFAPDLHPLTPELPLTFTVDSPHPPYLYDLRWIGGGTLFRRNWVLYTYIYTYTNMYTSRTRPMLNRPRYVIM